MIRAGRNKSQCCDLCRQLILTSQNAVVYRSVVCISFMYVMFVSDVLIQEYYLLDSMSWNKVLKKEEAGQMLGAALASMEQLRELQ